MADYNLVVLVGRLTRDPELKYPPNGGTPFTKLGMAINHTSNMPDGSYQKSVTFVDISVWQHQAEIVCQVLRKGSTFLVAGALELLRWVDKDGQKRSKLRVRAQRVQFMDRKLVPEPVVAGGGEAEPVAAEAAVAGSHGGGNDGAEADDDE